MEILLVSMMRKIVLKILLQLVDVHHHDQIKMLHLVKLQYFDSVLALGLKKYQNPKSKILFQR